VRGWRASVPAAISSAAAAGDGAGEAGEAAPGVHVACEGCEVTTRFLGFHRIWQGSGRVFDTVDLDLPDSAYATQAAYARVPRAVRDACAAAGAPYRDGVHAASHALLNALPLLAPCSPDDVACECDAPYFNRTVPDRLLLYDRHPGGVGLAAAAAAVFVPLLRRALALVEGCDCGGGDGGGDAGGGCPGCVQHPLCSAYNGGLDKTAAALVLRGMLGLGPPA